MSCMYILQQTWIIRVHAKDVVHASINNFRHSAIQANNKHCTKSKMILVQVLSAIK